MNNYFCPWSEKHLSGRCYGYLGCEFYFHEACANLPREIIHPLHSQHCVEALHDVSDCICNACSYIFSGFRFRCQDCKFELDFTCASSINSTQAQLIQDEGNERIQHSSHIHLLTPFNYRTTLMFSQVRQCNGLGIPLSGRCYGCMDCGFNFHKACTKLPHKIPHHLHSHKNLTMIFPTTYDHADDLSFICDECFYVFNGFRDHCYDWEFEHCLSYSASTSYKDQPTNDELEEGQRCYGEWKKQTIQHFSHDHLLTLFNYRKIHSYGNDCNWCEKPLSGMSYGCLKCGHFLHKSCADPEMPKNIQHPFHPLQSLCLHHTNNSAGCGACGRIISFRSIKYHCDECGFIIYPHCATLLPTLKPERHKHYLTYFEMFNTHSMFFGCITCHGRCDQTEGAFYRCVQCDFNVHLKCLPIEEAAKHPYHRHDLTLMDSFIERDSEIEQYYCDICEKERNPVHHVYCCKECAYVAHIECVLNQKESSPDMESDPWGTNNKVDNKAFIEEAMNPKEAEKPFSMELLAPVEPGETIDTIDNNKQIQMQIQHFSHKHLLHFNEVKDENHRCNGCRLELCGPAYMCEICDYKLHRTCAELPPEILHQLFILNVLSLLIL